ncbi:hypothetical protein ACTXT7_017616, partial [Hymenolepis weldensis]
ILDSLVKHKELVVCKFFKPGCGACQEFKNVFLNIASEINGPTYVEIDVTKNENISARYGIQYLPTTKVYFRGGVETFIGNQKDNITDSIRLKLSQARH